MPADGWYEWPVIDGTKRPQFISRADGPCYFAGLASITERTAPDQAGMVIITSDADGGLVDVHDRRPVALNESDARLWLDPALQPEAAEQLMHYGMLPSAAFRWWEVTKAVGNVRNEGSQLAMPLA
ncbi:hypothetical protein AWV79_35480 [Cupriavidus sp. UYMMa02A]|nr:hypothetical protein AWV79_35480 [Cupriavidus sp. UYMMa02A]